MPDQRRVLEEICDEESLDNFNFTKLHDSVVRISQTPVREAVKALMASSASINDVDSGGRTALSWAAQRGDAESVRLLLENGADPNIPPPGSAGFKTALHYAANTTASAECVSLLVEHGADTFAYESVGLSPMMTACFNRQYSYANLDVLLKCSDLEQTDFNGRTALFHGASTNIVPTKMLLNAGCNVNHQDKKGFTPLHLAISCKNADVVVELLQAGARYSSSVNSHSILHHAAIYADLKTIQALSTSKLRNLNINDQDDSDCTALDLLQNRIPQASSEILIAFGRLLEQIETLNTISTVWTAVSSDAESTMDWETASEGSLSEKHHDMNTIAL